MGEMIYLRDVVTLTLDRDRCAGCGMCMVVCPHEVFSLADGKAKIDDRDACMECGACAKNCPEGALTVKTGVGCAAAVINTALGVKKSSCCCVLDPEETKTTACFPDIGTGKGGCC